MAMVTDGEWMKSCSEKDTRKTNNVRCYKLYM